LIQLLTVNNERGFTVPTSRFMRGLCYHYGVELHNFAPNAISQAATFVAIYEGFLGIPVNWDLWVHLFRAELHTLATGETRVRQAVRAGGLTFALRDLRKELYLLCTMTSNNADCEKGWFYLCNNGAGLPLHRQGADGEDRRVAPQRVAFLTSAEVEVALHRAAAPGGHRTGSASIIANFHHRRIDPLMERELRIFEMSDTANPTSLVCSRLLQERLLPKYAAIRARLAVSLKSVPHSDDDLWSFVMLPDAPAVSTPLLPAWVFISHSCRS
jgi:hypothetical protein